MSDAPNRFLVAGAGLSTLAALLHVAIIFVGPSWYRLFGAGEQMARLAESGHWYPPLITTGIALVLGAWALVAASAAGVIAPLPLLKPALCVITAIYLLRGLAVLPMFAIDRALATPFWWWSSAICLVYGLVHLIGLHQMWSRL